MKLNKSKKLMLAFLGAFMVFMILTLFTMRCHVYEVFGDGNTPGLKTIEVDPIERLEINGAWTVKLKQDKQQRIALNAQLPDSLWLRSGAVFILRPDTSRPAQEKYVEIAVPRMYEISARNGAQIDLQSFEQDSMKVTLINNCVFQGSENVVVKLQFDNVGNNKIELIDDPMQ